MLWISFWIQKLIHNVSFWIQKLMLNVSFWTKKIWIQKLLLWISFWTHKLTENISFWIQKLTLFVSFFSGPRNWHYGSVSGSKNWHYGRGELYEIFCEQNLRDCGGKDSLGWSIIVLNQFYILWFSSFPSGDNSTYLLIIDLELKSSVLEIKRRRAWIVLNSTTILQ